MSSARQGGRNRQRGVSRNPPTTPAEINLRRENRKPRPGPNGNSATVNSRGGSRGLSNGGRGNAARGNRTQSSRHGASNSLGNAAPSKSGATFMNGAPAAKSNETPDERFQRLKRNRIKEREWQISNGFMADPDVPRALSEAITLVGTCQDMCPEYERAERIAQHDVWQLEKDPATLDLPFSSQKVDELRMVKKFRRPAAGIEEQLPSDLRPPEVLKRTLDFLIDEVIGKAHHLEEVYKFVWDRTRGIRNDFSVQNIKDAPQVRIAIDCFERIVRFHLLTLHQVGSRLREATGEYNHQQDMEQCGKTLVSLIAYYDSIRDRYRSPNEAEFRAYWIIMRIPRDSGANMEARVQKWPKEMLSHPRIQRALQIHAAACSAADPNPRANNQSQVVGQQNWSRFWKLVGSTQTSYLMACLAEVFFNVIRIPAIHAITQSYYRGYTRTVDDWTLDDLQDELALDDEEDVREFLETFGFNIEQRADGKDFLEFKDAKTRGFPNRVKPIRFSWFSQDLVEFKRFGRTFPAILNGLSVKAAREKGQIVEEEEPLFVSDEEQVSDADSEVASLPRQSSFNPTADAFQPTKPQPAAENSVTPSNPFGLSAQQPNLDQPSPFGSSKPPPGSVTTTESPFNPFGGPAKPLGSDSSPFGSVNPQLDPSETTTKNPPNPFATSFKTFGQPSSMSSSLGSVTATTASNPFGISASSNTQTLANPFGPKPSTASQLITPAEVLAVTSTTPAVSSSPFAPASSKSIIEPANLGPSLFTPRTTSATQPAASKTQESLFAGSLQASTSPSSAAPSIGSAANPLTKQSPLPQLTTTQQSLPSLFQSTASPGSVAPSIGLVSSPLMNQSPLTQITTSQESSPSFFQPPTALPSSTTGLFQPRPDGANSIPQQTSKPASFQFPLPPSANSTLKQSTPLPAPQPAGDTLFKFLASAKDSESSQSKQPSVEQAISPFMSTNLPSPFPQPGTSQSQSSLTSSGSVLAQAPSEFQPTPKKQVRFATPDDKPGPRATGPTSLSLAKSDDSAGSIAPGPSSSLLAKPTNPVSQSQPGADGIRKPTSEGISNISARATRKELGLNYIATQLLMDPVCGFLKQYIEYSVAPIFEEAMKERETELARKKADAFRWNSLARRYWQTWRKMSSMLRHRREGRARRARLATEKMERARKRKEQGQQKLTTKNYDKAIADFEEATGKAQSSHGEPIRKSSLVAPTTLTNRSSNVAPDKQSHKRTNTEPAPSASMMGPPSQTHDKQPYKESRRSSLISSSFLSGEPLRESINSGSLGGRLSTVTSTYFRLKARGLESHSEPHIERTGRKRMRMSDGHESSLLSPPSTTSPPEHIVAKSSPPRSHPTYGTSAGKSLAAGMLEQRYTPEASPPHKRKSRNELIDEDEDLFARVRAVREAMDESISFYREETKKANEASRSSSVQGNSANVLRQNAASPDQLFQSQTFPPRNYFQQSQSQESSQSDRPKYWSRVSKFIPREEYGLGPASKRARLDTLHGKARSQWIPLASSAPQQAMMNGNGHNWNDDDDEEDEEGIDDEEEEEYEEEDGFDDEYDESEDGRMPPEALKGGNSVEDAIEL